MRTKTRRGGRRKPSRCSAVSSPSSTAAVPSVPDRDVLNGECSTRNDGFASDQNVCNAEDNSLNEESRKETQDVLEKVDCFQKDTCIICDESGDLLICTEIGCPIAYHEYCISCQPSFDDDGHFYCPYCSYKNTLVLVNELKRKAMVAKRVLSDFIDTRMVGGGNSLLMGGAGKKRSFDVSTRGVNAELINHGNHLGNESSQDQVMQVEDHMRTAGDAHSVSLVRVNGENQGSHIVGNVSNDIRSTSEVQSCEDSMNKWENLVYTTETHQVENLEDKEDEKMIEEENLRLKDDIEDEEIVKDQGQPKTSSSHHDEEEALVEDVDRGAMMEEEKLMSTDDIEREEILKDQGQPETFSAHHDEEEDAIEDVDHAAGRESEDAGDGGEQIQSVKERMLENINPASGNNDFKKKKFAKKKRFKTKANRKVDLQSFKSPRKSLSQRTSDPGDKSPNAQPPEPEKNQVFASRKIKQPASPDQLKNLNFDGRKCKRVRWSTEEEEMLKVGKLSSHLITDRRLSAVLNEAEEGVQRFSSTTKKNLPWRKILEFGHHIFDNTRTPVDLKDKWRNVLAK